MSIHNRCFHGEIRKNIYLIPILILTFDWDLWWADNKQNRLTQNDCRWLILCLITVQGIHNHKMYFYNCNQNNTVYIERQYILFDFFTKLLPLILGLRSEFQVIDSSQLWVTKYSLQSGASHHSSSWHFILLLLLLLFIYLFFFCRANKVWYFILHNSDEMSRPTCTFSGKKKKKKKNIWKFHLQQVWRCFKCLLQLQQTTFWYFYLFIY